MILLAFLLPVALYLLVLGAINRRPYPLVVSGTWDCIGLLAASSGLLLLGGPAILSSLNEKWRNFWLLGTGNPTSSLDDIQQMWIFLSILYFAVVVCVAWYMLWRNRQVTVIYNVEPDTVGIALEQIFSRLGLSPLRSGQMYLFGSNLQQRSYPGHEEQALPPLDESTEPNPVTEALESLRVQNAVLDVDAFPTMQHVSLRWDPAESTIRASVENELRLILQRTPTPPSEVGAWLTISGVALMVLFLIGLLALVVRWLLP